MATAVSSPLYSPNGSSPTVAKTSNSRRTSLTSFQTAPLASSTSASSSRDSLTSQNTLNVVDARRSRARDNADGGVSFLPTPAVTVVATSAIPLGKGKERETSPPGARLLAHGSALPRLEVLPHPIYTPPSPPPSASPVDDRTFDINTTPKKRVPVFVETPAALTSQEQHGILRAMDEEPSPAVPAKDVNNGTPARMQPHRTGSLPLVPISPILDSSSSAHSNNNEPGPSSGTPRQVRISNEGQVVTLPPVTKIPIVALADNTLLQPPPPAGGARPTRRNTTGSTANRPSRNLQGAHSHMSVQLSGGVPGYGFPAYGAGVPDDGIPGELDTEILKEAEQIRAERRAKAQQEAEAAMTAPPAKKGKGASVDEDQPVVGKMIEEGHVNYVLMYNMLTGIRTLHHGEHKFLRRVLKQYHAHMKANPHSLLSRFYGLHRVKMPHGKKIHFIVMNNLFPPHRDIHETYDLKGSTVGREYPEERAAANPRAVLKDLNWIHRGRTLELGPEKRALLTEQIRRDVELLKEINVMDYSLLIGIHNMQRGNRDNLRRNTLRVFSPSVPPRKPAASQSSSRSEAIAMRKAMRQSDPKAIGSHPGAHLPEQDPEENKQFIFYQDEGGYRATDESNQNMDTIYYFGIIDICTLWTPLKRMENIWKGFSNDRHKISPVPAQEYGDRFFAFMQAVMRGGEGGERFLEKPPERTREKVE
ncbi:Phosphatidylinositol-4-phosphate 5-kinase [Tulasnella sp. UAMH 9824]|nr:Phosphatidylinositol-4-phosphate 5-kinase [Tulasnella sp. UAMH 9824]